MYGKSKTILGIGFCIAELLFSTPSFAQSGDHGGDPCVKRIREIQDNIKLWLKADNWKGLTFTSKDPIDQFKPKMIHAIENATLACTTDKVKVDDLEVTCKNSVSKKGKIHFTCNFNRFMNPSLADEHLKELGNDKESIQYGLIFHENCGASGYEITNDFHLSKQISAKLVNVVEKRLPILPYSEWETDIRKTGYLCSESLYDSRPNGSTKTLIVDRDGRFWYMQYSFLRSRPDAEPNEINELKIISSGVLDYSMCSMEDDFSAKDKNSDFLIIGTTSLASLNERMLRASMEFFSDVFTVQVGRGVYSNIGSKGRNLAFFTSHDAPTVLSCEPDPHQPTFWRLKSELSKLTRGSNHHFKWQE